MRFSICFFFIWVLLVGCQKESAPEPIVEESGEIFLLSNHTGHVARCDKGETLTFVLRTAKNTEEFMVPADTRGFYGFEIEEGESLHISIWDGNGEKLPIQATKTYYRVKPEDVKNGLVETQYPLIRVCTKDELIVLNL